MAKAPAFQFYANDFMDATSMWEANAVGLYVRCLCKQWTHGSIPSDLRILARAIHSDLSELQGCWDVIGPKFEPQPDGTLKNRKLESVRERQEYVSAKRSEAGKAGANAKANAKANGQAKEQQRKVKEKVEGEVEEEGEIQERPREPISTSPEIFTDPIRDRFETLWVAFERHGTKTLALKKYKALSDADRDQVDAAAPQYVHSTFTDGRFPSRKYLEGWLTADNRLWERPVLKSNRPDPTQERRSTTSDRDQPITIAKRRPLPNQA